MKRSRGSWCWRVLIGILTLPLFQGACVDLTQRSMINGFFNAVTPLVDEHLKDKLEDVVAGGTGP
jgi:hypothetical protein